jgi:hypothetical protein
MASPGDELRRCRASARARTQFGNLGTVTGDDEGFPASYPVKNLAAVVAQVPNRH